MTERTKKEGFTHNELMVYLEAARIALGDAEFFDRVAGRLDIADKEMVRLSEKLINWLEAEPCGHPGVGLDRICPNCLDWTGSVTMGGS